jgi:cardiolipin synthase
MLRRAQIPNLLTYARLLAVPACLAIILLDPSVTVGHGQTFKMFPSTVPIILDKQVLLLLIFTLASLTDFLDGYLARKWNAVSPIGALLDPIADKLLVALMLVYLLTVIGAVLFLPIAVILLRELYISGLREFLANRRITLPVSKGGKWKTALQMLAIFLLLWSHMCGHPAADVNSFADGKGAGACMLHTYYVDGYIYGAGAILLCLAALLAVTSAVAYTRASVRLLRQAT